MIRRVVDERQRWTDDRMQQLRDAYAAQAPAATSSGFWAQLALAVGSTAGAVEKVAREAGLLPKRIDKADRPKRSYHKGA